MASGHVNRINRPNTWLHRPMLQNVKKALANSEPSTHGTSRCRGDAVIPSLSERSGYSASRDYRIGFMSTVHRCSGHLRGAGVAADIAIMKATDTITLHEGYAAMRIFLQTVSRLA